ncbi:MAG: queuosine precursor transporter [Pseudomonadota bacterium]
MQAQAKTSLTQMAGFVALMCAVVALSNYLVQSGENGPLFPVNFQLGPINLADLLTWAAFTYPVAFFVTDLTNRRFGPRQAHIVVLAGFALAVVLSIWLATPRIAIASGTAFLVAQLLDVSIFNRMRRRTWWKAPLISSIIGSLIDTLIFFTLALAPFFSGIDLFFGMEDGSLGFAVPFLTFGPEVPLWASLAFGDFCVKIVVGLAMLIPYGVLLRVSSPAWEQGQRA